MIDAGQADGYWVSVVLVGARCVYLDRGRARAISDCDVSMGQGILQHVVFNPS
jgi:hypothetical protein